MVLLYIIQGFIFIYDVISYPFYYFIQKPWLVTERRERVKARQLDPSDPASPWERTPDSLSTASLKSLAGNNKCQNINQLFNEAVKIYANENCLGVRPVLEEKYKNGRLNKVVLADDYEWITYRDAELKVNYYAKGFKSCGIEKGDKVIMYADTCKEWFLASQSLFKIGAVMATLYTSLGTEEVAHGIHETQAKYVITNKKTLNNLLKIVTKLQNIKSIIVLDQKEVKEKENNNVNIVSLEEIELMGIGSKDDVNETITLDDVAFIMYTSGSSGKPKGVMLTHRNVLSAIKTLTTHLYSITEDSKNNIYVAYLPLAHILEFAAELIFFSNGIALGYSSTFTLTDKSPGIMQGQKGDLTILRPTIFITVPLVLERMKKAIIDKIEKQGSFLKVFFEFAIDYKYQWGLRGFITPILDFCIFNSIKNVLGGRVRLVSCGGAPLAQETHKFCNSCFGINIMQGYGSTETCSAISLIDIDDPTFENVGEPLPYTQIKLVDWPEGGYRVTDTPRPRGEILVYSDHVAKGYYQNDELTKEAFIQDSDGKIWFMTGDIGEMLEGGKLKIVDRKKDIVKLQHGEYISLGKVENALIMSEYVNNICVYCNPNESKPVALVLPNQFEIKRLINKLDLDKEMSWENICQNEKVIKTVKDSLTEAAVAGGLKGFEIPSKFKLCSDEWNIDNGLLTPSLKIVRRSIYSFYKNEIDKMYREL